MKQILTATWILSTLLVGCSGDKAPQSSEPLQTLILATTTSTEDTGLLDVLIPTFERETGIQVKRVAVGTGQALEMGRRKEADVLLVHAPLKEQAFVKDGFGENRRAVMHNNFVIVGPAHDPAQIKGMNDTPAALQKVYAAKAPWVSRGDNSGTHTKEQQLWRAAGIEPAGDWYLETGQGMGASLRVASERRAYTLSDRATYLATRRMALEVLTEGDRQLHNPYHVMEVTGTKAQRAAVRKLSDFFVAPDTQRMIAKFTKDGHKLFTPDALQARLTPR